MHPSPNPKSQRIVRNKDPSHQKNWWDDAWASSMPHPFCQRASCRTRMDRLLSRADGFAPPTWWRDDDAGVMARHIFDMLEILWGFLYFDGTESSNNRAERDLRMGLLWRKRSLGTQSEKGNCWVESILSLVETCRINGLRTFDVLNNAIRCHFENSRPCTSWI